MAMWFVCFFYRNFIVNAILVEVQLLIMYCVYYCTQDGNEKLKPVPSLPGDREMLLRVLDGHQQEIDWLPGMPFAIVTYTACWLFLYVCLCQV